MRPSRKSSPAIASSAPPLPVFCCCCDVAAERARERGAEADQVRAALGRVDVVREGVDRSRCRSRCTGARPRSRRARARRADWKLRSPAIRIGGACSGCARSIQVLDEGDDAALVAEVVVLPVRSSLITMRTPAFRKASSRRRCESVSKENSVLAKISPSGLKVTLVPVLSLVPTGSEVAHRLAALVALGVDLAVALDLELEPLGERVHDRDADAVEAARDLVALLVELPAGVEARQHHLGRGPLLGRVHVHRDAAAVVHHRDRAVVVDGDDGSAAEAGERLVDRVVDDLVDQVVQAVGTGGPDVHRRPLPDRLEAFEHLDGTRVVAHCCSARRTTAAQHEGRWRRWILLRPRVMGERGRTGGSYRREAGAEGGQGSKNPFFYDALRAFFGGPARASSASRRRRSRGRPWGALRRAIRRPGDPAGPPSRRAH